ncbi:hypothetical protein PEM37_39540 [Streptomyces sp. AD681]|uniref:hypothetical protein n=1 Tax=Streptomyces sp. AD681 TaxID=3019069 RepID=UPI0022F1A127|nr:hypothetical protein [Streptomyces sp. AD681]MDA5147589.1 hypothetical protein [Streptomyces sp. AD681]
MFTVVRRRSTVLLGAVGIVGAAAIAGGLLLVGEARDQESGDPDPNTGGLVSVCSDVTVHAWVTVNLGSVARPDTRKVDYDVEATGHDRDPFGSTLATGCNMASGAFGSRMAFTAPGLAKLEGVQSMLWAVDLMEQGHNLARHIKGGDAILDAGE